MKIIFLGTPEFAVKILEKLVKSKHSVVAVVSQPDKPVGRKQILEPTPTKKFAIDNNIPVYQFQKIKKEGEILKELNADVMVTVAYGQILSKEILELTKYGTINVHGSLLPKYRGAAPFQWAIINGEKKTGVTIMKSDVGIDDGPIYKMKDFEIKETDSLNDLYNKASQIAPDLLLECLDDLENNGDIIFTKQNENESSYYPMLKNSISYIDFNKTKREILNLIRGISEWPTATCLLNGLRFNIYSACEKQLNLNLDDYKNGEVVECSGKKGITIKVSDGFISLKDVQLQSAKKMDAKSFANGNKIKEKDLLYKIEE